MKKRLRKKLHKGEFQEFGFSIKGEFNQELSTDELHEFTANLDELEDEKFIHFDGGFDPKRFSWFVSRYRGSFTPEEGFEIEKWSKDHPQVKVVKAEPLVDAWY